MRAILFAFLAITSCVVAAPRQKRFAGAMSYAGPYGAYAGPSRTFSSSMRSGSTSGFGFGPYFPMPMPVPMPFFPFAQPWSWPAPEDYPIPWQMGPNVCNTTKIFESPNNEEMKEALKEMGVSFYSSGGFSTSESKEEMCKGECGNYKCLERKMTDSGMQTKIISYSCCDGFQLAADPKWGGWKAGCYEMDLRYLMPTLRKMGAFEFVKLIEKLGMGNEFYNKNYTVFCPLNSALEIFQRDLEDEVDNEIVAKPSFRKLQKKTRLHNFLLSHLTTEILKINNLNDNKVIQTENAISNIRINFFYTLGKIVTANCVPVLTADHFARNGMINIVEKILPTPTKTVADIIASDFQFSILKRMLSMAGLVQTLRNPNGTFTMFAPTDSSFAVSMKSSGSENRCTVSVMKHHILDYIICSAALPRNLRSQNMIGELLSLTRDADNKLYVDGVQIVVRDIMAKNGVVHIIDGMLSTRQTKLVSQVLEESGLSEFLAMLEKENLLEEFDSFVNTTFFVPIDDAMQVFRSPDFKSSSNQKKYVPEILKFHVAEGQTEVKQNDQILQSKLENATLKFQVQTKYLQSAPLILVQCATVLSANIKFCGGTLHVIDKLILPPKMNIVELLESKEEFSTLVLLLRATNLDKRLSDAHLAHTILAPTDDAFHQMGTKALFSLLEDTNRAIDLVKMHVLLGNVCCTQLKNDMLSGRTDARAVDGTLLPLHRSTDNLLMVGDAHLVNCDIMATNGIVHMVDSVVSLHSTLFLGGGYIDNRVQIV